MDRVTGVPVTGPQFDGRRALAALVDAAILFAGGFALATALGDLGNGLPALAVAWALYYYFAFESSGGQTPGKRLLGLRVVRVDGGTVGMREAAVRTILRVVDGVGLYVVGLVVMLATGGRRQRLGDLAAGTVVTAADVPTQPAAEVPSPALSPAPAPGASSAPAALRPPAEPLVPGSGEGWTVAPPPASATPPLPPGIGTPLPSARPEEPSVPEPRELRPLEAPAPEAPRDAAAAESPLHAVPAPAEEAHVEEASTEEAPVDEAPVEDASDEEIRVEEPSVDTAPVEEAPIEEAAVEEAPLREVPVEDAPAETAEVETAPIREVPLEEVPVEDAPPAEPADDDAVVEPVQDLKPASPVEPEPDPREELLRAIDEHASDDAPTLRPSRLEIVSNPIELVMGDDESSEPATDPSPDASGDAPSEDGTDAA